MDSGFSLNGGIPLFLLGIVPKFFCALAFIRTVGADIRRSAVDIRKSGGDIRTNSDHISTTEEYIRKSQLY